jgi:hypothetical protein
MSIHRTNGLRVIVAASAFGYAGAAHASALDDFRQGDALHLDLFRASASVPPLFSGTAEGGNVCLAKDPGSLDVRIPASALGIDAPNTLTLHGTATGGNEVAWRVDEYFAPPLPLPNSFLSTDHVWGTVVGDLQEMQTPWSRSCDGTSPAELFAVQLGSPAGASTLTAHVLWSTIAGNIGFGDYSTGDIAFTGVTGPISPGSTDIASLSHGPHRVCQTTSNQSFAVWLGLTGPAPREGLVVSLADSPGISTPSYAYVGAEQTGTSIPLVVLAGASGEQLLAATTSTSTATLGIDVLTQVQCSGIAYVPQLVATPSSLLPPSCPACRPRVVGLGDDGTLLEEDDGTLLLDDLGKGSVLSAPPGTSRVAAVGFNAEQQVLGVMHFDTEELGGSGGHDGFLSGPFWNMNAVTPIPFEPVALNDAGDVLTEDYFGASGPRVYFDYKGTAFELPLGEGASFATALNNQGLVIGTRAGKRGLDGFVYWGGRTVDSADLGGQGSIPFALDDLGNVVGAAVTPSGKWHATISQPLASLGNTGGSGGSVPPVTAVPLPPTQPPAVRTKDLGTLPGFEESYATHINANGHVLGFSIGGRKRPTPFVYTPELGMVDLENTIVGPDIVGPDLQVESILAFNDEDVIAVRARRLGTGTQGVYLLMPK